MTHPRKQRVLDIFGREPATMDELAQCVIAVVNTYKEYRITGRGKKSIRTETPGPRVVGFSWQITHSDCVSNSHSQPLDGVSNWGGKDDKPKGYPGWTGRVWIRYEKEPTSFGSDPMANTLTHTGTGGYGGYGGPWEAISSARWRRYGHEREASMYPQIACYSWDYRIYDMDWPLIQEVYEKELIWGILADKPVYNLSHRFLWEDSATKLADTEFLADCVIWNAQQSKEKA